MPSDAKLLPIKIMLCECLIINSHKINFCCNITFDDDMNIPPFVEKCSDLYYLKYLNV